MTQQDTVQKMPIAPSSKPTFEHMLSLFAYHVSVLMTEAPRKGTFAFGDLLVEWEIRDGGETSKVEGKVWDQVWMNGRWCGNRCGGYGEYTKLCAPVLARVAAGTFTW